MIHSFKNYLIEEDKVAYFTLGRMNPPTTGHEKLLDALAKQAGKNDYFVFVTQSQDKKKNPLNYNAKVKHIRKMYPRHARRVMINKKIRTVFDAANFLYEKGYKSVVMVVGSDRVNEFTTLLNKYNNKEGRHGFYNFQSLDIASAGARDPDAEGVAGMSASKMRAFASENDFTSFSQGLPRSVSNKDAKKLFNDYVIFHLDNKAVKETEKQRIEREKDPVIFGRIEYSDKYYFIADWEDELDDLRLKDLIKQLSFSRKDLTLKQKVTMP